MAKSSWKIQFADVYWLNNASARAKKKTRACIGADRNAESTQEIVAEVKCQ